MKRCHFVKRLAFAAAALLLAVAAAPIVRADEIDDAVAMFTADDGLTAAEKIPALKAPIERISSRASSSSHAGGSSRKGVRRTPSPPSTSPPRGASPWTFAQSVPLR